MMYTGWMGRPQGTDDQFTEIDIQWWMLIMNGDLWRVVIEELPGGEAYHNNIIFKNKYKYIAKTAGLHSYVRLATVEISDGIYRHYAYVQTMLEMRRGRFDQGWHAQHNWKPAPPVILRAPENRNKKTGIDYVISQRPEDAGKPIMGQSLHYIMEQIQCLNDELKASLKVTEQVGAFIHGHITLDDLTKLFESWAGRVVSAPSDLPPAQLTAAAAPRAPLTAPVLEPYDPPQHLAHLLNRPAPPPQPASPTDTAEPRPEGS